MEAKRHELLALNENAASDCPSAASYSSGTANLLISLLA